MYYKEKSSKWKQNEQDKSNVMKEKPEILAPAGSMDALKAAIYAGADAIYLGGSRFGARAFANNFDGDELIKAIEYSHLYGVKVYLTINTLFRDEELEQLYDYLLAPYMNGLDAVIVQDFGVMKYVHEHFPDLPIHASTQMTITTPYAFSLLKEYGVTRVVPARELSINEIAQLKSDKDACPETEVFVQGALCYCYSGQCLMSSFLGGRSGNRGRCAQTCRLPYHLDKNTHSIEGHLLSPKDLCGLQNIPDLIEAGVDSFKIEGRMKKPEYVAACVRAYRECVDAYYTNSLSKALIQKHTNDMADVFNRGGFTEGYYKKHNGKDMMYTKSPGNIGVLIGTIKTIQKNKIHIQLKKEVFVGDLFILNVKNETINLTCNTTGKAGETIVLNAPKSNILKNGMEVRRMLNATLMNELQPYIENERIIPVEGEMSLREGEKAILKLTTTNKSQTYTIVSTGDLVESATKNPLSKQDVIKKITATGATRYSFTEFQLDISDNAFYSLKALKDLRRTALEQLEEAILAESKRLEPNSEVKTDNESAVYDNSSNNKPVKEVIISNKEQFDVIKNYTNIDIIIFDMQYFDIDDIKRCIPSCKQKIYIALPAILRKQNINDVKDILESINNNDLPIEGIVIRNIDEFAYVLRTNYKGNIITDYSFYIMNYSSYKFVKKHIPDAQITLSVELNDQQLIKLQEKNLDSSLLVYGQQPLMISAQCVQNTTEACNHGNQDIIITDRYRKPFRIHTICKYCYNIIYNGVPTVLFDLKLPLLMQKNAQRLHFTNESGAETEFVLNCYLENKEYNKEKTRGHYKRGVD